jgi:PAS domain S-box-containing protein
VEGFKIQKDPLLENNGGDINWSDIFNAIVHPTFIIDDSHIILAANSISRDLIALDESEIIGTQCFKLIHGPERDKPPEGCPMVTLLDEGLTETVEMEMELSNGYGLVSCAPIINKNDPNMFIHIVTDITDRKVAEKKVKSSLDEKTILLREIHHRVKNNMQIISSLLDLQSQYFENERDADLFLDSKNRVKSMAMIHDKLYQSEDFMCVDLEDYIIKLSKDLFSTYNMDFNQVLIKIEWEVVAKLDINTAMPLGLLINELITNSLKHAFPGNMSGELKISMIKKNGEFVMVVSDNGVGMPGYINFEDPDTLGLQLVNSLVHQIDGQISLDRTNGTRFEVIFPE